MRSASTPILTKSDFRDVCWAGAFGSFARGKQSDRSDIDVVAWQKSALESKVVAEIYLFPAFVEDELPRAWNRDVDVVYVQDDDFRGYTAIESVLCSQTLYGSARDAEGLNLRRAALRILDEGRDQYAEVVDLINQVQAILNDVCLEVIFPIPIHDSTLTLNFRCP